MWGCCCDQEYNLKISRTNGKDTFERTCTNKNRTLVYKPNNSEFFTQGAVDSSTHIDRIRLKTIQKIQIHMNLLKMLHDLVVHILRLTFINLNYKQTTITVFIEPEI